MVVDESNPSPTCLVDYKTGNYPEIPQGAVSFRHELLFGENELKWDKPRPNFTKNKFCLRCHTESQGTPALKITAPLSGGEVIALEDPRRQPDTPPRWLKGYYPANYFEPGSEPIKCSATSTNPSCLTDYWFLR